jgi:predicted permease
MRLISNRVKHVLRRLSRAPLFTAVTLATLAISIGANTAVFSVIEGVLLKPLPFPKSGELVSVRHTAPGVNIKDLSASPSMYFVYREENRAFQDIGLWEGNTVNVTGLAEPERVESLTVTDRVLPLLGVQPILGRWFSRHDDSPGSPETVILSYGYWQRKFGANRSIIGRRMEIDGKLREVIGVLPAGFRFLTQRAELLLPFQFDRNKLYLGNFSYAAMARLKPGVTVAQANADATRLLPIVNAEFPAPPGYSAKVFENARIAPAIRPLKQDVVGDIGRVLWVLMGTIGMVLAIACANVANLLLVRAEGRQHELAIRTALGAGRRQIAGEILFESLALGVAGGVLGLGLAYGALRLLVAMGPAGLPRLEEIAIDPWVLVFTLLVSLFSGALFGLIPVLKYAGPNTMNALRQGGRTLGASRERHRARNALVVAQVALALVLLVCSGLMIRTFQALRHVEPGFVHPEQVETLRIFIPSALVKDDVAVVHTDEDIVQRMAAIPGVSAVGFASTITMDGSRSFDPILAEDRHFAEGQLPPLRRYKFASPGFLHTVGNPLLAGRDFTWTDVYNKAPVAIVTENFAREWWHEPQSALGKRIRESLDGRWREIIGVTGDERDDGAEHAAPTTVYWPVMMDHFWGNDTFIRREVAFAIRSSRTGSSGFLNEIRQAVWSANANLPVANVRTLDEIYRKSMARTSFALVMLAIAGGMALLLGLVGIYGVISYSVSQRTREIGIRMALGAREPQLRRMFVRNGLALAAIGVVCGLAAAIAFTHWMASLLFDVRPLDPLTYAAVAVALFAAAALASYLPSRRATSVDPVDALRAD